MFLSRIFHCTVPSYVVYNCCKVSTINCRSIWKSDQRNILHDKSHCNSTCGFTRGCRQSRWWANPSGKFYYFLNFLFLIRFFDRFACRTQYDKYNVHIILERKGVYNFKVIFTFLYRSYNGQELFLHSIATLKDDTLKQ